VIRARNTGSKKEAKKERKRKGKKRKKAKRRHAVCWTAPASLDEEIEFLSPLNGGA
jgi:hypothetical protein